MLHLMKQLNKFNLHFTNPIYNNDSLGCEFIVSHDNKRGRLGQPLVIESLSMKFGPLVQDIQSTRTLAHPVYQAVG